MPEKSNARPSLFLPAGAVENDADHEKSDNEDSAGLVHWSSEDVFFQGGVRTIVGTEKSGLDLDEEPASKKRPQEERPHEEVAEVADRIEV